MINGGVIFNVTLPPKNASVFFSSRLLTILYSLYTYIFIKRKKGVPGLE